MVHQNLNFSILQVLQGRYDAFSYGHADAYPTFIERSNEFPTLTLFINLNSIHYVQGSLFGPIVQIIMDNLKNGAQNLLKIGIAVKYLKLILLRRLDEVH